MLNNDEAIEKVRKATGTEYSNEQKEVLQYNGGMCILACAGSGKTSTIVSLLAKRYLTREITDIRKVLCTTYSKAGTVEMNERIDKLFKVLNINEKLTVKTMHASYLQVLKAFSLDRKICSELERTYMIAEACKQNNVQLEDEDMQTLNSLLSFQVNNIMTDEKLCQSYVFTLEDVNMEKYSLIRNAYAKLKNEKGVMDYDDMQFIVYYQLVHAKNEQMIQYCRSMWTDFYVDEFQDISRIQFEILRAMCPNSEKLVVIGDDDQCIYQWRGAEPKIILNIQGYYDIKNFVLSTNYRCLGDIVNFAAVGIKNNEKRADKTMYPATQGGEIKVYDCGSTDLYRMSLAAYKYIKLELENGVRASDIAVLCRNNAQLTILGTLLFKDGVYCNTSTDMKITNNSTYKDIKALMEICSDTYSNTLVRSYLWKMVPYLGVKGCSAVSNFMFETHCSLMNTLGYLFNYLSMVDGEFAWKGTIKNIPRKALARLEYMIQGAKSETVQGLIYVYKLLVCSSSLEEKFKAILSIYHESVSFMYKTQERKRLLKGMCRLSLDIAKEIGLSETEAFFAMLERYESGNIEVYEDKITMTTMHSAKGREWKQVILFADDNVTFPSFESIERMIVKGVNEKDISASIDESRRLHYVAITRAKEKQVIFTDRDNTSVFTLEALGLLTKQDSVMNENIIKIARHGLNAEINQQLHEAVFSDSSKYNLGIDLST